MANLKEIAELAFNQLFPNPGDEVAVDREDFVATAKTRYAYEVWRKIKEDKVVYGECEIPSWLLTEKEFEVKNNQIDLTGTGIMRGIDEELWLQDVGGMNCDCVYVKSSVNKWKGLCDDDSLPDDAKIFYPQGLLIKFPLGVHADKLPVMYAKSAEDIEDVVEVDDVLGDIVRRALVETYGGRVGVEDEKNDSNTNFK